MNWTAENALPPVAGAAAKDGKLTVDVAPVKTGTDPVLIELVVPNPPYGLGGTAAVVRPRVQPSPPPPPPPAEGMDEVAESDPPSTSIAWYEVLSARVEAPPVVAAAAAGAAGAPKAAPAS